MTSPLVNPIVEALVAAWSEPDYSPDARLYLRDAEAAADACIAVVAALPETHTAVDVLAFLRGEDVVAGDFVCPECGPYTPVLNRAHRCANGGQVWVDVPDDAPSQDDSAGWLEASHVDNASTGTAEDQHPCGGVKGPHSWPDEDTAPQHVADRCVDCGTTFGDWIEATA